MEFCRFRDFVVPLLGLSTRHPSIHEMRATRLVDSSFRAPRLPDDTGTRLCLGRTILRSILDRFAQARACLPPTPAVAYLFLARCRRSSVS
jgi:hypothetical protein